MRKSTETNNPDRFRVGDRVICYRRGRWWWAEHYDGRKQRRQALNTTSKKQAHRFAIQLEASLLDGSYREAPPNKTVAEVISLYEERLVTEDLAESTSTRYRPEFERWRAFLADQGVTRIGDVDLAVVERYRASRRGQVAPTTLYHESMIVKQLVNFAHDRGFIAVNPLKKMKLKRPKPAPQPTFSMDQVDAIITAAGVYADVYEVLAFTGLRVGELRWLTWDDVKLDEGGQSGFIHIRVKPGEWRPKDRDDRKVPLHPRVARILARLPRRHRFVFTAQPSKEYPGGGRQMSDRRLLVKLKQILKRLGIGAGKVHTFRHFFISFCANNGVMPFELMAWVGHSDLSVVLGYYNLGDDDSRRAMSGVPFGTAPDGGSAAEAKKARIEHISNARKTG